MKKKLLLLLPLLMLSLVSCEKEETIKTYTYAQTGMTVLCQHTLANDTYITFIRDSYTDNIYMQAWEGHGYAGGGGLSPYYNSKGELMKYTEFLTVHKH